MSQRLSDTLDPNDCPDPSVHGNPFRYCPYCSWREAPSPKAAEHPTITDDAVREAWHRMKGNGYTACESMQHDGIRASDEATLATALADRERLRSQLRCPSCTEAAVVAYNDPAFVRVPREVLEAKVATWDSPFAEYLLREYGGVK